MSTTTKRIASISAAAALFLLAVWYALSWLFRRDIPRKKLFLRLAAGSGVLSIMALEAGWVVTEVGRQPWIVYDLSLIHI